VLHNQCNCGASDSLAKASGAIIRLGMAKVRNNFFAIVGSIQWLSATWANTVAAKPILDFKGAE
jgi:hypothetical protein